MKKSCLFANEFRQSVTKMSPKYYKQSNYPSEMVSSNSLRLLTGIKTTKTTGNNQNLNSNIGSMTFSNMTKVKQVFC